MRARRVGVGVTGDAAALAVDEGELRGSGEALPDGSGDTDAGGGARSRARGGSDGVALVPSGSLSGLPGMITLIARDGQVSVSWPVAAAIGDSPAPGYELHWRTGAQRFDDSRRAVVIGLSYTVLGLVEGAVYTVRVRPTVVERAEAGGASITAATGTAPSAEVVQHPVQVDEALRVSALAGPVKFGFAGEPVWPATIEIPVDLSKITDRDKIELYYFNEATGWWMPEPGAVLDLERGVITAEVYHLTFWNPFTWELPKPVKEAIAYVGGFLDDAWDETTGWLQEDWYTAGDLFVSDIPRLARAVLDKVAAADEVLSEWERTTLEHVANLPADAADLFVQGIRQLFITRIDPPICSALPPSWVSEIDVEADNGINDISELPLLVCGETETPVPSREDLRLKIGMNRGFSMRLGAYGPSGERYPIVDTDETDPGITF